MEQKSNRPVDWEAFVLRYEAKLYRTALAIWAPPGAEDAYKTRSSSTWKRPPFFSTRRRRRPG